MSYERSMAGAHLVATHSVRRLTSGTPANSAANSLALAPDATRALTRSNSADQTSSVGLSSPAKDERRTSPPLLDSLRRARRALASPAERRFVLEPSPTMTFPDVETVGSTRTERWVYISLTIGSRRGPPTKGDDSGDDSAAPKSSPHRTVTVDPPTASSSVVGTSMTSPPNKLPRSPFSFFSSTFTSSSPPRTSTLVAPAEQASAACRAATLMLFLRKFDVSFVVSRCSAVIPRWTLSASSTHPSYVTSRLDDPAVQLSMLPSADPGAPSVPMRESAAAPASSNEPPPEDIASTVALESLTAFPPAVVEGRETTNHRTEAPSLADSTEAISPMPPGGEMTTTSGFSAWSRVDRGDAGLCPLCCCC
mmetsp:Transcript_1144/g.2717  ORF Transcript_1144/g.2717 Transcript_1144/m.2717 type:complete len:366 (-) Transcript_1144:205-1302(-)